MKSHATAFIPIRNPNRLPIRDYTEYAWYEDCLTKFMGQLITFLNKEREGLVIEDISIGEITDDVKNDLNIDNKLLAPWMHDFIKVEASWETSVALMREMNPHMHSSSNEELLFGTSSIRLSAALDKVFMLSEISHPGVFDIYPGVVYESGKLAYTTSKKASFRELMDYIDNGGNDWPSIQILDFGDVYNWANKHGFGNERYAKTRITRALAAFTNVISLTWVREGEVLFRTMQALEAFYTNSTGDLRSQLSEKSKIFLGSNSSRSNLVGKLYDVRSKFVHGAAHIQFAGDFVEANDAESKDIDRFENNWQFGLRLLVATLQACVIRDLMDIEWGYRFHETKG